jgi:hypothetical protein
MPPRSALLIRLVGRRAKKLSFIIAPAVENIGNPHTTSLNLIGDHCGVFEYDRSQSVFEVVPWAAAIWREPDPFASGAFPLRKASRR